MNGFLSLFATILFCSQEALGLAIVSAALAGLLAIVVLAFNIFCRRWLSARQMSLLWGLVLLRLLLPVAPSSSLSLQNLLTRAENEIAAPSDPPFIPYQDSEVGYARPLPTSAATPSNSAAPVAPEIAESSLDFSVVENWICTLLPIVWLAGGIATLVGATFVHLLFCRRLKTAAACADQRLGALWNACRQQAAVRRDIPIVLTDRIDQPAVLGLFRPKLLLPEDAADLDDRQLRMIMLHELAHVQRWHIAANWALLVIRAIHWWNPVYWLAAARFQNLREQACDAFAIQRMAGESSREYGELLLTLIRRNQSRPAWRVMLPASILGFISSFFRKRAVRNRLKALPTAGVVRSRWQAATVAALVALAAACGLTDASTPEPTPEPSFDWLPRAASWGSQDLLRTDPGPNTTRTYNVEKALDQIACKTLSRGDARMETKSLIILMLTALESQPRLASLLGLETAVPANDSRELQERVSLDGNTLTVTASDSAHAEIVRNLAAWEQSGLAQICVETRFLSSPEDIASALGISWQYLEGFSDEDGEEPLVEGNGSTPTVRAKAAVEDYLPIAVAKLTEKQAHALVQTAQSHPVANVLQAPKVTMFNGQRAIILDRTQTPFVVGIREEQTGAQHAKVAVIDEGIKLDLRTVQSSNAAKVELEARIELSQIKEVGTASTMLNGSPTTIQIPRVKRCRIDVASEVDDGQSLLIGCIPAYEQKKFFYILLRPRILELLTEEAD